MSNSPGKLFLYVAYLYIIVPFLIFFFGWLQWYYALIACGILLISTILSLRKYADFRGSLIPGDRKHLLYVTLIIGVVVFFSGIGGYAYQNEDHQFRNALFRDLITHRWPFIINENHTIPFFDRPAVYIYYFIYFLPSALLGKIAGWGIANFVLFLWTVCGLFLVYYFISCVVGRYSYSVLFVFLLFNGLYLAGSFLRYPVMNVMKSDYTLWAGDMLLAGDGLSGIYWIYNQTIVPWLIAAIILNRMPKGNYLFLFSLCYLHGPFFFIGFFPFLVVIMLRETDWSHPFMTIVRPYLSFQNIIGGACVLVVSYLFLAGSPYVESAYLKFDGVKKYLLFVVLSFGITTAILFSKYRKEPFLYVAVAILCILPVVRYGTMQPFTLCARVSLAPMFILMVLTAKYLLETTSPLMRKLIVCYLVLGAVEPMLEFGRSVVFTAGYYVNRQAMNKYLFERSDQWSVRKTVIKRYEDAADKNFLVQDDLGSIDSPDYPLHRYCKYGKKVSFFDRYLLKR